jgi:hypothetical protein
MFMIGINMEGDLERVIEKIRDKYKFEGIKEPLLNPQNILYMLWRIKGLAWHEIGNEDFDIEGCDLALYADRIFDEISTTSDAWLNYLTSFNINCLQHISNKKVLEMLLDLLVLRNIYYELRKSF